MNILGGGDERQLGIYILYENTIKLFTLQKKTASSNLKKKEKQKTKRLYFKKTD